MHGAFRPLPIVAATITSLCVVVWSLWLDLQRLEGGFLEEANRVDRVLTQRVSNLGTVLVSLAGLYHASDEINTAEVTGFSEDLLRAYPFISRIMHLQSVADSEREAFEEAMHVQGLVGFRIHGSADDPDGRQGLAPSTRLAIDFLEPLDPLVSNLFGFDMASHPDIRQALDAAIASGGIAATGEIRLKPGAAPAHYVLKAVYLGRYPPQTTQERRAMVSGLVGLEVRLARLIEHLPLRPGFTLSFREVRHTPGDSGYLRLGDGTVHAHLRRGPEWGLDLSRDLELNAYGQPLTLVVAQRVHLADLELERLLASWFVMMCVLAFVDTAYAGRRAAQRAAKAAAAATAAEGERFSQVINNAFDAVITSDACGCVVSWNQTATEIFGYPSEAVLGKPLFPLIVTDDALGALQEELAFPVSSNEDARASRRLETRGRDSAGRVFPLEIAVSKVVVDDAVLLSVFARDITERQKSDQRIRQLAYFDPLTQLPNRQLFKEHATMALESAKRHRRNGAVLFLDLDGFKRINDTLGHDLGDLLLIGVGERLQDLLRSADRVSHPGTSGSSDTTHTVTRLGGDEFTVLLPEVRDAISVTVVARRIQAAIANPFSLGGHEVYVTPSIGIALFPRDGDTVDEILKNADTAMYHAKSVGKNNFQIYSEDMNARANERLKLEGELRKALERDQLQLVYQPQIDVKSGRVIAAECLLRWHHPTLGSIPPFEFIPLAEETGMILEIGAWVLDEACRQNKAWQDAGLDAIKVAVNLSPVQFAQCGLSETVERTLDRFDLQPQYLELEITESIIMRNVEETIATLQRMQELGISVSIDDFGTGYSSLSMLAELPLDIVKIDRSLIRGVVDPRAVETVRATVRLGAALGLTVLAEGVEDEAERSALFDADVDLAQGYLLARPMSFLDLEAAVAGGALHV